MFFLGCNNERLKHLNRLETKIEIDRLPTTVRVQCSIQIHSINIGKFFFYIPVSHENALQENEKAKGDEGIPLQSVISSAEQYLLTPATTPSVRAN